MNSVELTQTIRFENINAEINQYLLLQDFRHFLHFSILFVSTNWKDEYFVFLYSIFPSTIFHRKTRNVFYDYVLINWNPEIYRWISMRNMIFVLWFQHRIICHHFSMVDIIKDSFFAIYFIKKCSTNFNWSNFHLVVQWFAIHSVSDIYW